MRKRKWFGVCGVLAFFVGGGLTALGVTLKHEPNFYQQCQVPEGDARVFLANQFLSNFGQMMADISARQDENWRCQFTEKQLNSFLDDTFPKLGEGEGLRKMGISSPAFMLEDDRVRLAFRYGSDWFSTVVSYDLKVWLVPKEPNTIAVEILSARAGAVPISSQSLLHQLSEFGRKQNKKVSLYRHEGNSVAVIHLQADQDPHPKWLLTALQINHTGVSIHGRTPEHAMQPLDLSKTFKPALAP
ncbi:MAG TPA: hypothetical protein VFE62_09145 [Gemmataceae bacterium]|nr:hypothetical protein [Gemmataceae bacterium]